MRLDQLLHYRQPNSRASGGPSSRSIGSIEALEDVRQMLWCDAAASVTHLEPHAIQGRLGAQLDRSAGGCVHERIG